MEEEFDVTKNYYEILGVGPGATIEELKAAHVRLALQHHPDRKTNESEYEKKLSGKSENDASKRFVEISEAWAVLSKAEVRLKYDTARRQNYGKDPNSITPGGYKYPANAGASAPTKIDESYIPYEQHYEFHVKQAASSNWRDLIDKYKTEKWQNTPLEVRIVRMPLKLRNRFSYLIRAMINLPFISGWHHVYEH
jgi:curved DNA-binding protein CbpA